MLPLPELVIHESLSSPATAQGDMGSLCRQVSTHFLLKLFDVFCCDRKKIYVLMAFYHRFTLMDASSTWQTTCLLFISCALWIVVLPSTFCQCQWQKLMSEALLNTPLSQWILHLLHIHSLAKTYVMLYLVPLFTYFYVNILFNSNLS